MPLLGAHMSIAGGLYRAIERGDALGCEAIQIFTQSSRTWQTTPLDDETIALFKKAKKAAKTVKDVVAHNSYLLNLSTVNEPIRKKSVDYFIQAMERCEALEISGLITHPGGHLGAGVEAGIQMTSKTLNEVLRACKGFRTQLILENTAGQGSCIGCTFEQLAGIVEGVEEPDKIFFCFDTQHAFAAGYDLRTLEGYETTFQKFDSLLGLKKLRAFHLNDALKDFDCHVDRHANIGKGFLGVEAFRPLMNDSRFGTIPMCLETDPGENDQKHREDLNTLRSLIS
jgi:deoxyribonuclease IV